MTGQGMSFQPVDGISVWRSNYLEEFDSNLREVTRQSCELTDECIALVFN
jgi:hypothetical protein